MPDVEETAREIARKLPRWKAEAEAAANARRDPRAYEQVLVARLTPVLAELAGGRTPDPDPVEEPPCL